MKLSGMVSRAKFSGIKEKKNNTPYYEGNETNMVDLKWGQMCKT